MLSVLSCVRLFTALSTVARQAPLFLGFPSQGYWSALPFPPPEDLADPGIKPTFLCLLHCRQILYPLSHQGSPNKGLGMINTKFRLVVTLSGVGREVQCKSTLSLLSLIRIYKDEKCNRKGTNFLLNKKMKWCHYYGCGHGWSFNAYVQFLFYYVHAC